VQVYYGSVDSEGNIASGHTISMELRETLSDGTLQYNTEIPCEYTGQHGFSLRILPFNQHLDNPHEMGLITWFKS